MITAHHSEQWRSLPFQGSFSELFLKTKVSNTFIERGWVPPAAFKWVLRARCDLLPTKSSLKRRKILSTSEEGLSCRLCGEEKESLPHILNKCVVSKALQTVRHDAIQNLLVKCLPKN
ncbi:hypothetical protein HZS_1166 [Henneguya salminicola]|nr:hypothetical protein HZS_1166 [Henneguya salminicola]